MRWLLLLAGLGCGSPREAEPPPPLPKPTHLFVPKNADREVDIVVNGKRFTTLVPEQLRDGVRLDELLIDHPLATWKSITLYAGRAAPIEWSEPALLYLGHVPLASLDGDRPIVAFVEPTKRGDAVARAEDVEEVRIELAKRPRTKDEELAAGCLPEPKGEEPPPPPPKKWRGTTNQFNLSLHWRVWMNVDLSDGPVGAHVGSTSVETVESNQPCKYDLYRMRDRNRRRAVMAKVRSGPSCVDAILELSCDGKTLALRGYYASNGEYVERGALTAAK